MPTMGPELGKSLVMFQITEECHRTNIQPVLRLVLTEERLDHWEKLIVIPSTSRKRLIVSGMTASDDLANAERI